MALALAAAVVFLRSTVPVPWHGSAVLVAGLACVPWLQYSVGLLSFAGQAWISTAYLLGLLVAMLTGQRWERIVPGQLPSALFLAIGIASVVSVNLQLQTWLGLVESGVTDIWSMGLAGDRPYANLGQPNQLATLLLWGLLACIWGFIHQQIRPSVALLLAGFLLLGIALTQSRTAWLGLTFLLLATWAWRRLWPSRWLPWCVTAVYLFFWACPFLLREFADALLLGTDNSYLRGSQLQGELRFQVWRLFIEAALHQPWWGYGWSEVTHAQLAVAANFPSLQITFAHSHNLFLDLILWLGIPLGILVSVALLGWFVSIIRVVSKPKDAILVMWLGVIGIHAMLELPLHYAYFLVPTGMVIGILNSRLGSAVLWTTPRWVGIGLWLAVAILFLMIVRDYFRVEASFERLRFELARINTLQVGQPPEVAVLTQLRERINLVRYQPKAGMSAQEMDWVRQVVNAYPGMGMLYKAASVFALNKRPEEATQWLRKICKISSPQECDLGRRVWAQEARTNPLIAAVPWPE